MKPQLTFLASILLLATAAVAQQPEKKEYMYRVQPMRPAMLTKGPTPAEKSIISEHFSRLAELTGKGVVEFAGRTTNTDKTSFGIIIFRAESEAAAREIMNNDPAVKQGVMKATLFPFHTALMEGRPIE
jgi:uncharacterized protein YciI